MNNLELTLLKVLSEESHNNSHIGVEKAQYIRVLDQCIRQYGEVDLALAISSLHQLGI